MEWYEYAVKPRSLVEWHVWKSDTALCDRRWKLWVQPSLLPQSAVRVERSCALFETRVLDQRDKGCRHLWPQQTRAEIAISMNLFPPSSILILAHFTLKLAPFGYVLSRWTTLVFLHTTLKFLTFFPCIFFNDPLLLIPLLLQTPTLLCVYIVNITAESRASRTEQL